MTQMFNQFVLHDFDVQNDIDYLNIVENYFEEMENL